MMPERLLTDLRIHNIRVRVDGDLIRCKPPEGAVIPVDLTEQIRALKPQLLELLRLEEQEIAWRAASIGASLLGDRDERIPGFCSWCGAAMPHQQTGKCVLCCLAAAELVEQRLDSASKATYPLSNVMAGDSGTELGLRDMTPERDAA